MSGNSIKMPGLILSEIQPKSFLRLQKKYVGLRGKETPMPLKYLYNPNPIWAQKVFGFCLEYWLSHRVFWFLVC